MNAPINMHEMAKRDPAVACLMGAIAGYDFGYSVPSQPYTPPSAFASGPQFGDDYGFGFGFGNMGFGAHHGHGHHAAHPAAHHAAHPHHPSHPAHPHHAAHAAHHAAMQDPSSTVSRTLALDPNRNSTVKVERYSFSFSPTTNLVLGTASAIANFTQQPSASIKGERILMNAPAYGFVFVSTLQIANVNVLVGGQEDAHNYAAEAQGVFLELPRLDPQNRATAAGSYTGSLPQGFTAGTSYPFVITMQGPAVLAGGYGQ